LVSFERAAARIATAAIHLSMPIATGVTFLQMKGRTLVGLKHFITAPISDANKNDFRDPRQLVFQSTKFFAMKIRKHNHDPTDFQIF